MASFDILSGRSKPAGGIYLECDDTHFELSSGNLMLKESYLETKIAQIKHDVSYAPYYVQSSAPSGSYHGWLWYDTTTNKLYQYNAYKADWVEIDWVTAIQATPEWQAGKLRINSGILQITPNSGTNWFDCYPALGAHSILLQNYSVKYFPFYDINIVCTGPSATVIPIVFAKELPTLFEYRLHTPNAVDMPALSFSGQNANGEYRVLYHDGAGTYAHSYNDADTYVRIADYTKQCTGRLSIFGHITTNFLSLGVKSGPYWCIFRGEYDILLSSYTNPYYIGTISWNTGGYLVWRKIQ